MRQTWQSALSVGPVSLPSRSLRGAAMRGRGFSFETLVDRAEPCQLDWQDSIEVTLLPDLTSTGIVYSTSTGTTVLYSN